MSGFRTFTPRPLLQQLCNPEHGERTSRLWRSADITAPLERLERERERERERDVERDLDLDLDLDLEQRRARRGPAIL